MSWKISIQFIEICPSGTSAYEVNGVHQTCNLHAGFGCPFGYGCYVLSPDAGYGYCCSGYEYRNPGRLRSFIIVVSDNNFSRL